MEFVAVKVNEEWKYYAEERFIPEQIKKMELPVREIELDMYGKVSKDTAYPENIGQSSTIFNEIIPTILPF